MGVRGLEIVGREVVFEGVGGNNRCLRPEVIAAGSPLVRRLRQKPASTLLTNAVIFMKVQLL